MRSLVLSRRSMRRRGMGGSVLGLLGRGSMVRRGVRRLFFSGGLLGSSLVLSGGLLGSLGRLLRALLAATTAALRALVLSASEMDVLVLHRLVDKLGVNQVRVYHRWRGGGRGSRYDIGSDWIGSPGA